MQEGANLFHAVDIMGADDLARLGARASVTKTTIIIIIHHHQFHWEFSRKTFMTVRNKRLVFGVQKTSCVELFLVLSLAHSWDDCSGPSHYLSQRLVIVNWTLRNELQWNFNQNTKLFIHENASENIVCEMGAILSREDALRESLLLEIRSSYWCRALGTVSI